jgi:hypothetical protein
MNLGNNSSFTEVDYAIEEAQFLAQKERTKYSVVQVAGPAGRRFYALPTMNIVEVCILETFDPLLGADPVVGEGQ